MVREDNILCVDIDFKGLGHSKEDLDFVLKNIVKECGTYWEVSASGEGLHLYYKVSADLELNYAQFGISEYNAEGKILNGEVGLYMDKRFIIVIDGPCGGQLSELTAYGQQAVTVANSRPRVDYDAVVNGAVCNQVEFDRALESAKKSKHWWPGQDTGDGMSDNSHSAGDMALFKHIAIQVNYCAEAALEIFKQSPRYTPERIKKKNVNRDYFAMEAKKACASRFLEEASKNLVLSTVQLNLAPARPAGPPVASPPTPPAKVAKPADIAPEPVKPIPQFKDAETGVVLALDSAFHLPTGFENYSVTPQKETLAHKVVTAIDSPVALPVAKMRKQEEVAIKQESWPALQDGRPNPSNVDYSTPEGFICFVTAHDDDFLVVKVAKLLMARVESVATSTDTYLLNSLILLSSLIGPKVKNSMDGENSSLFASPRIINVGDTGTGKTVMANAVQELLQVVPADARPSMFSGLPVSGQAVHDQLASVGTGNGLLWYLPEVAELLVADSSDAQRRSPHLFEANKLLFITAADATTYGTQLPAMLSVTKNRPAVQGVYLTTYGDCTKEIFSSIFDNSATRGTTNRGIFNLMVPAIPAWTNQLDNEPPQRKRDLARMLAEAQAAREDVITRLTELGRGEFTPGKRYSRLDPLRLYLASKSDRPTIVEDLLQDVKNTATHNINARATQHIRSLLQTVAVCDMLYDEQLDRFCVNEVLAEIIIGLVVRAGDALSNVGGLIKASFSTNDKYQDAVLSNIKKILTKGVPSVHAHRRVELSHGFIGKSLAIHGMQNHPTIASNPNGRIILTSALTDLAEAGFYLTEVVPAEKAMHNLAPNGTWYKLNIEAFDAI
ncbi:hypothetical protein D3C78_621330 [compost metagenome]